MVYLMDSDLATVQIGSIQIFCKAAEFGSFTAAAASLGLTPAAVSRSVARIEERLRVQLFARSTRQVRLTDNGRLYFEQCREAIEQLENVERVLTGNRATPSGTLRISVPTTYGNLRLLPLLEKFKQKYPQVIFEVNISNRNIDFVDQGYDLAIRLGTPQDSRLVARRLEDASLGVYATRAYLARCGEPQTLADLHQHDCIQFVRPSTGRPMPWIFRDGNTDVDFPFESTVRFSGDVLGCVGYAAIGGGLFQTYDFIATNPRYQDLVEVLPDYRGRSRSFCIIYPHNRHLSAKVRALVDWLTSGVDALAQNTRHRAGVM
ncbi:LysR family transcriptional regulator [Verminephrobacter aporrectodeae subsp. tuberculatae]|nr:LysR family transcriptional regulator [Verminephrobacter aporrectodeae subsp. tuberculatae]